VDIKYHHVRDVIAREEVCIKYVPTNENVANIFIKNSQKEKHNNFVKSLGLNEKL